MEREIYDDPRHAYLERVARELYQHVLSQRAPESIYDWLMKAMAKVAPAENAQAVLDWQPSFSFYDAEIQRRIEQANLPEAKRKIYDWPWASWNRLIDPIEPGLLAVLAGPDGAGKTTYAENIAEYWARRGLKVAFVHFELSKLIMLDRRATRHTAIARRRLKLAGDLTPNDLAAIAEAKRRLLAWPGSITYVHTPGWSVELVVRELGKLQAAGKCEVAVVDYLEKAAPSNSQLRQFGANYYQREANDVELLKNFSENAGIPLLLLSQFNKAGKTVGFADLDRGAIRGAGEKTEKANVVVLLRPDEQTPGVMNVKVDKNTLGAKGAFQQYVDFAHYLVGDLKE